MISQDEGPLIVGVHALVAAGLAWVLPADVDDDDERDTERDKYAKIGAGRTVLARDPTGLDWHTVPVRHSCLDADEGTCEVASRAMP